MTTLLLIAIGPVQPFIAAARKIRDLAVGSWLLSELSKAVARSLQEQGCELIFPAKGADLAEGSALSVANKILAEVPAGANPQDISEAAHKAMRAAREKFYANAWGRLAEMAGGADSELTDMRALFEKQREATGEFYAVWAKADSYPAARRQVEQLLAARKTARMFAAPAWDGAGKRKSSLDGVWETLLPEKSKESALRRLLEKRLLLKQGEHLDALALVKRLPPGKREQWKFDGLAEVALETWLEGARRSPDWERLSNSYEKLFPGFEAEYYLPAAREEWIKDEQPANAAAVRASAKALKDTFGEPEPYGCILCGDGDHMGRALDAIEDAPGHRRFSEKLSDFARDAGHIVRKHAGELIYSGGDDVLAFLPLHTAAACAVELRIAFVAAMDQACPTTHQQRPTFSAGIAVVHVKTPLDFSLTLARRAESMAKNKYGRNALCWLWNTRGNAEMTVGGKWDHPWRERLANAAGLYRGRRLSRRTGYQIRAATRVFGGALQFTGGQPNDVLTAEVVRILRHKQSSGLSGDEDLAASLRLDVSGESLTPTALADTLVLARRLARAADIAEGKRPADEAGDE